MTATTTASGSDPGAGWGWDPCPQLVEWTEQDVRRARWTVVGYSMFFAVGEWSTTKTAIAPFVEVRDAATSERLAGVTAGGLIAIAALLMYLAAKASHDRRERVALWVTVGVWALLGAGIVFVRAMHAVLRPVAMEWGASAEEIQAATESAQRAGLISAVVLGVLYAAAGWLVYRKSHEVTHPGLGQLLKAKRSRQELLARYEPATSRARQAGHQLASRYAQLDALPTQLAHHEAELGAMERSGMEESRRTQALLLGDPRMTGMVHHRPEPQSRPAQPGTTEDAAETKPPAPDGSGRP